MNNQIDEMSKSMVPGATFSFLASGSPESSYIHAAVWPSYCNNTVAGCDGGLMISKSGCTNWNLVKDNSCPADRYRNRQEPIDSPGARSPAADSTAANPKPA